MAQTHRSFETTVTQRVRLNYLLHLPPGYEAHDQTDDKNAGAWPLVFFLHGAGERGSDLNKLKQHGIPKVVETKRDFPMIAVSPQCPARSWWTAEIEALAALLEDVIELYAVDEKRIYLTGLSMGGYGSWELAMHRPERFAALVPICGGGEVARACDISHIPTWVFHGGKDTVVPVEASLGTKDGKGSGSLWRPRQADHLPPHRPRLLDKSV